MQLTRRTRSRGFSLFEVMVALVVLSIGLLGVAKLEAVAFASTTVASKRSLAAVQAAGLAAAMHANRGYWTNADAAGAGIQVTGSAVAVTNLAPNLATSLAGSVTCKSIASPCLPTDLAAFDLKDWAGGLSTLLPNETANINCGSVTPVTCTINVVWNESSIATNAQEASAKAAASASASFENPSYTLWVQP